MFNRRLVALAASVALFTTQVHAASIPFMPGPWDPGNALGSINSWIQNYLNPAVGSAASDFIFPRNLLDNAEFQINQRAATATCGTTSGTAETSYSADRWACDVNFTTGAGQLAVVAGGPPGFQEEQTVVKNSGVLAPPTCAVQELPFQRAAAIAGKAVDFSVYEKALSGLSADNGNLAFLALITGTDSGGTGFGTLRSGPGMSTSNKAVSTTVSTSTGLFTSAVTAVAGQPIYFSAAAMPGGLTAGQTYYVSTDSLTSGTSYKIAATYAQAIAGGNDIVPSSGGTTVLANSPTFTPAWAGLTIYSHSQPGGTASQAGFGVILASDQYTLNASNWTRLDTGPMYLAQGITEAAVLACFNPNNQTTGGSTDGFAFAGPQLEVLTSNRTSATAFEFHSQAYDAAEADRFFYQIDDAAAGSAIGPVGTLLTTTTCQLVFNLPVPMDTTPIMATNANTTSTFKIYVAADTSTLTTATITATYGADNRAVSITPTLTTSSTAGWACILAGQSAVSGGYINWGVDF